MGQNVYDFDNTIFAGDSSVRFYCHCVKRKPSILLDLPAVGVWLIGMQLGLVEKTRFKERLYRYFTKVEDIRSAVTAFWDENFQRIKPWYLAVKRADDVIISASPEFLLAPACQRLGVTLLASQVDETTGKYRGLNCHGEEKVRTLKAVMPTIVVDKAYSDSRSDTPLALLAKQAYLVKGDRLLPW